MDKLAEYYKRINEKIKEKKWEDFQIEYIENGNKVKRDLLEISDQEFDFLIRVHFILKNNIYGVDKDKDAHLIAKARMIIEVFKFYNKKLDEKYYIFPNLEININEGNSLIGFIDIENIELDFISLPPKSRLINLNKKQLLLTTWTKDQKIEWLKELVKKKQELKIKSMFEYQESKFELKEIQKARKLLNKKFLKLLKAKKIFLSEEYLSKLKPFH